MDCRADAAPTTATGAALVEAARRYLGTPFHWGGANWHGMDCAGLLLAALHDIGRDFEPPMPYGRQVNQIAIKAALRQVCDRIDLHCPITLYNTEGTALMEAGDFLLFAVGGQPQHLAIANGEGGMIHTHEGVGRVVEHGIDAGWMRRLVGVWRWRGSDE